MRGMDGGDWFLLVLLWSLILSAIATAVLRILKWQGIYAGRVDEYLLKFWGFIGKYAWFFAMWCLCSIMWLIEEALQRMSGSLKKVLGVGYLTSILTWPWEKFWDQTFGRAREAIGKYVIKPYYPIVLYRTRKGVVRNVWRRDKTEKAAPERAVDEAKWDTTSNGLDLAYLEAERGAVKSLTDEGADVVVALNPRFGSAKVRRFTIAGNCVQVNAVLPRIQEAGWSANPKGERVFSSPQRDSQLTMKEVVEIVKSVL